MQITPKTEKELAANTLLPEGEYPFTVIDSNEVASKSAKNAGRLMFAIKLNVHADFDKHVYDYFADWFAEYKLRHFAYSIGLGDAYESGNLDARDGALKGRQGFVRIKIEEDKTGIYGPKNVVKDYTVKEPKKAEPAKQNPAGLNLNPPGVESDDAPF